MPLPVKHLSYSSYSRYKRCPRQWYHSYVEKRWGPSNENFILGTAFHGALQDFVESPTDIEGLMTSYDQRLMEEVVRNPGILTDENRAKVHELGQRMLTKSIGSVGELIPAHDKRGAMIERKVQFMVPGVPVPIIGYIDIVRAEDMVAVDIKTSKSRWSEDRANKEDQPTFYLLAATMDPGLGIDPDLFMYFVVGKQKRDTSVQLLETSRTLDQKFYLMSTVKDMWDDVMVKRFRPNPNGWWCNEKFCDHWELCMGKPGGPPKDVG